MKLRVVIPCYNERDNIPLIVKRIDESFKARKNVDIIFVDNGSTDGSDEIFTKLLAGKSLMRCIRIEQNLGYGHGILTGLDAEGEGDVYAWTHADMQTDPTDVLLAFDLLCKEKNVETNIVKGKRKNRAPLDNIFTYLMSVISSLLLSIKVDDVNAQPKVFTKKFYNAYIRGQAPLDFSLDLFLLCKAHKAGMTILEVPVVFADRKYGDAKGGGSWRTRIKLIKRTLAYILHLRRILN